MEQYLAARALYPGPHVRFSFFGHSHGTYVVAKALETYERCRFENIVFAGSIVREDYDWGRLIANGQVARVMNIVATRDWVVAFFPQLFRHFNLQDLGGAGHRGFAEARDDGPVFNVRYAIGGHAAGLDENAWDGIADFLLDKEGKRKPVLSAEVTADRRLTVGRPVSVAVWLLSWVNIVIWAILAVVALFAVPGAILRWWPDFARGVQSSVQSWLNAMSLHEQLLAGGVVMALVVAIYARLILGSGRPSSLGEVVRSLVAFPLSLAGIVALGFKLPEWFPVLARLYPTWPPVEQWGMGLIVFWYGLVLWVLRKV